MAIYCARCGQEATIVDGRPWCTTHGPGADGSEVHPYVPDPAPRPVSPKSRPLQPRHAFGPPTAESRYYREVSAEVDRLMGIAGSAGKLSYELEMRTRRFSERIFARLRELNAPGSLEAKQFLQSLMESKALADAELLLSPVVAPEPARPQMIYGSVDNYKPCSMSGCMNIGTVAHGGAMFCKPCAEKYMPKALTNEKPESVDEPSKVTPLDASDVPSQPPNSDSVKESPSKRSWLSSILNRKNPGN
jgi:hypothetical protein